jgi:hypothetical protein
MKIDGIHASGVLIVAKMSAAHKINLGNIQSGSLAGAAHLLKDNAGVQRLTHLG